ncbi:hypothetical protein FJ959_09840 [Mesorhizobium sp. B2-2-4]|uniref:DUF6950 family protein n=1 Tax=unclassified Mesorhizobium TaxID=325217 RepID=UPI00112849B8|nr:MULTISPECIES: hypothetical protein [unclassified Mesorhizobium]TPM59160.1 hypothetical protein FJ959_09840 [Mesorhizobium sp. B2-2-4]TPM67645.1 hypothetical protein FJ965_10980 [Mesorhizobium sp. B2-2-1]TPN66927.1 hypothetical protein FJ984_15845 [Mesorhizobium sp. B1-1-3]
MTSQPRLKDWDRRLARVTEKHLAMPGVWGVSDCLQTDGEAVEAVIGANPFAEVAGRYKTEAGAARLLRKRGFANVEEALASLFPKMPRLMARRGDLAVVERNGQLCAGYICEYGAAVKTETGLTFVPQTEIRSAFRVGD